MRKKKNEEEQDKWETQFISSTVCTKIMQHQSHVSNSHDGRVDMMFFQVTLATTFVTNSTSWSCWASQNYCHWLWTWNADYNYLKHIDSSIQFFKNKDLCMLILMRCNVSYCQNLDAIQMVWRSSASPEDWAAACMAASATSMNVCVKAGHFECS